MWKMLMAITLFLCATSCSSEAPPVTPDPLEGEAWPVEEGVVEQDAGPQPVPPPPVEVPAPRQIERDRKVVSVPEQVVLHRHAERDTNRAFAGVPPQGEEWCGSGIGERRDARKVVRVEVQMDGYMGTSCTRTGSGDRIIQINDEEARVRSEQARAMTRRDAAYELCVRFPLYHHSWHCFESRIERRRDHRTSWEFAWSPDSNLNFVWTPIGGGATQTLEIYRRGCQAVTQPEARQWGELFALADVALRSVGGAEVVGDAAYRLSAPARQPVEQGYSVGVPKQPTYYSVKNFEHIYFGSYQEQGRCE